MEHVIFTEYGEAAVLTVSRPKALNSLDMQTLSELDQTLDKVDIGKTRCMVITGAGSKAFVAGADIGLMRHFTKEEATNFSRYGNYIMRKIETFPIPVIAAVNGYALGGGCELALACDIRLASENAVFGLPETGIGVMPGFGGTQRLVRLLPVGRAKELLYTADRLDAAQALAVGLVNAVYPPEQLMDEALALAQRIVKNAPIGVRAAKKAVNEGLTGGITAGMEAEAELFGSCFETEDQLTGMTAFLEKQKEVCFVNQ